MFANITENSKGFPRISHNGYNYGRKKMNNCNKYFEDSSLWVCTGNANKRRCNAMLETKRINGYIMLHERKQHHICKPVKK